MKRVARPLAATLTGLALLVAPTLLPAQSAIATTLMVTAESQIVYPSMEPITAIAVQLAAPSQMYDLMNAALAAGWDCALPASYKVAVVNKSGGTLRDVRQVRIADVVLQGNEDGTNRRLRQCALGNPGQVQLVLESDIAPTETVQVSLAGLPNGLAAQSDGSLKLPSARIYTFTASPQAAPGQKLTNGKSRDTGQLTVSFGDSNLFHSMPFNSYLKSNDLFSTDERDSKSAFSATMGIQRGVISRWYAPLHLEESLQGNQVASNLNAVTNLGLTTLLPWAWSRKILNNQVIEAPLPPDLTIDNQYTHRLRQQPLSTSPLLAIDDYSVNPRISWQSISLPWVCKVLGRLNGESTSAGGAHVMAPQYCAGIALNLGLWYLPLDLTAARTQRVEGYGDVSVLIPLAGLSFASKIFPYLTTGDSAKSQIRIKYSDSVNAANNYARSKQWTYGIELIK